MATVTLNLSGGSKMQGVLSKLQKRLSASKFVSVGFIDGQTYPDGTLVAQAAFWNEFGTITAPPRPFFRTMIKKEAPTWGPKMGKVLRAAQYDSSKTLKLMGELINGQLVGSIRELTSPALSPTTLMLRKMKDQNSSLVVTYATVIEARRRVAAGEQGATGTRAKPLIDTGQMLRATGYQVKA